MAVANPFPGMNPYLEEPRLWGEVHSALMNALWRQLNERLPENYFASIEERVYLETPTVFRQIIPDLLIAKPRPVPPGASATAVADPPMHIEIAAEPVREPYVEIIALRNGERVLVAVIELLSPTNKTPNAEGRRIYLEKQQMLLNSSTHLMEIDLLHYGEHTVFLPRAAILSEGDWDYLVALHRTGWGGLQGDVWLTRLEQRLPRVSLPLLPEDGAVVLDLQAAVEQIYLEGRFHQKINYATNRLCRSPMNNARG
jgi:hypothetical protein